MRIAAQNDAGTGKFSSSLSVITNATARWKITPGVDCQGIEFVFNEDVSGPVLLHQVTTNFTSITFSWTAPSDHSGAIADYEIQLTNDGISSKVKGAKELYVLPDLIPDIRVEFSVSAVSICGAVGVLSTIYNWINKCYCRLRYRIWSKNSLVLSISYFLWTYM